MVPSAKYLLKMLGLFWDVWVKLWSMCGCGCLPIITHSYLHLWWPCPTIMTMMAFICIPAACVLHKAITKMLQNQFVFYTLYFWGCKISLCCYTGCASDVVCVVVLLMLQNQPVLFYRLCFWCCVCCCASDVAKSVCVVLQAMLLMLSVLLYFWCCKISLCCYTCCASSVVCVVLHFVLLMLQNQFVFYMLYFWCCKISLFGFQPACLMLLPWTWLTVVSVMDFTLVMNVQVKQSHNLLE